MPCVNRRSTVASIELLESRRLLSALPYPSGAGDLKARLVGAADFDATGSPDLLWEDYATGEIYVDLQQGAGQFARQTIGTVNDTSRWDLVGITDVNNDSATPDLVFFDNLLRRVAYWQVQSFVPVRFGYVSSPSIAEKWRFQAHGNFDGDHDSADFLWRNQENGRLCVWSMSLGTAFGGYYIIDGPKDQNWTIEVADDFTTDGKPDLLWRNYKTGQNAVWTMDWSAHTARVTNITMLASLNTTPQAWDIEAVGEFNNNNLDDIIFRNYTTGEVRGWSMNETIKLGEFTLYFNPTPFPF